MSGTVKEWQQRIKEAKGTLAWLRGKLRQARKQEACKHKRVDTPGSVFGETCLDCGLFLNNGGF